MKDNVKVGDRGYLRQFTKDCWVNDVKRPVEVIEVTPSYIVVCRAEVLFEDEDTGELTHMHYFDSEAKEMRPNPNGETETLYWHPKKKLWGGLGPDKDLPVYFINSGKFEYAPYLN